MSVTGHFGFRKAPAPLPKQTDEGGYSTEALETKAISPIATDYFLHSQSSTEK